MVRIRAEAEEDAPAVRRLVTHAFGASELGHNGEADLVDRLRSSCPEAVSLVATDGGEVVGQILFSPVVLSAGARPTGMALGPMAVDPARQRTGIGAALIEEGLRQLALRGCPFVVVLGHAGYYPRFGFEPAHRLGISHGFPGIPQDLFFVRVLDPDVVLAGGVALYRPEFGSQVDSPR